MYGSLFALFLAGSLSTGDPLLPERPDFAAAPPGETRAAASTFRAPGDR